MNYNTYESTKNYYYVFVGRNAVDGSSENKVTGNFSTYGRFLKFKTKADAKAYAKKHYSDHYYVHAGSAKTLRQYALGLSVADYCEDLNMLSA